MKIFYVEKMFIFHLSFFPFMKTPKESLLC